jgi:hypothetical protein
MYVPELHKQPGVTCRHCKGGCAIHETRPPVCRNFHCGYLCDDTIGDDWKPNRCHFIMVPRRDQNCVIVQVDPNYPDAWKKEPFYSALIRLARKGAAHGGMVYVSVGNTEYTLKPNM